MISIPSLAISLDAFAMTWSEKESRSVLISFKESVPMISRILPWRESWRSWVICAGVLLRKFLAASCMASGSVPILTFATASTLTLIKSFVGTDCSVLISTVICPRYNRSTLSRKGILIPARPISIRGFVRRPDMINALSGGALTYPAATMIIKKTTIAMIIIFVRLIMSSFSDRLLSIILLC